MLKKKHNKPWYSKWWVIMLFIFIGLYFLGSLNNIDSNYQTDTSNYNSKNSIIDNVEEIQEPINKDRTKYQQISPETENEILKDDYNIGKFSRDYEWEYDGYTYGLTFNLYPKVYKSFQERERTRDYDLFASDFYSKEFIKIITEVLRDYAKENDLSDEEIPCFIISFVQNLLYTSDDVTTGFDEYPRFPYETIYDDG